MLKQLSQNIVQNLWDTYSLSSTDMRSITAAFKQKGISQYTLDHFAIIDLPSHHSGIPALHRIFSELGYSERGKDYLADKQNDFLWMAESNCENLPARDVLPQVVIADFRLDEMPIAIKNIIYHYSQKTSSTAIDDIFALLQRVSAGDAHALIPCTNKILHYFTGRDWPLPTVKEFNTVREFNELLAWVLVFGRRPNHFTLSIHLLDHFTDLEDFHRFIETDTKLALNQEGGVIKGGKNSGIAQGSTSGISQTVHLADGEIAIPMGFIEFVWRYPKNPGNKDTAKWGDYFTDFIAKHADRVIESLYGD